MEGRLTNSDSAGAVPTTGMAPALSIENVSKRFPGTQALLDLTITIQVGEIRALVGGNGSGKSTLIKILSGYHRPDTGEIRVGGELLLEGHPKVSHRLGARFVHQDLGLVDDSSVLDNLFLNTRFPTRFGTVRSLQARRAAKTALERLGLDLDPRTPVRELTAAQKTGLAVARAVSGSDQHLIRLLVFDEPTAALPAAEVAALIEMVKNIAKSGVGILYVTHRLDEVFQLASQVTVMRNGQEVITTPVTGLTREKLVDYLVGSELIEANKQVEQITPSGDAPIFRVRDVNSRGLADITFDLYEGEVVGISGVTGSGRETLNAALFGAVPRYSGDVRIAETSIPSFRPDRALRSGVAFMPSDRRVYGGMMDMTAVENLTIADLKEFWKAPSLRHSLESKETAKWFAQLSVAPSWAYDMPLSSFSGGNQQKILLSKWLRLKPRVLLLEEPTQGVDISAKALIHHQLLKAAEGGCAVLISSSDIDELVGLCSRVLILREGRLVTTLRGANVNVSSVTRESLMASDSPKSSNKFQLSMGSL